MTLNYDSVVWSWSRVNGFNLALKGEGCLYSWYRSYIEDDRGIGNFFSEIGLVVHETSEKMFKKELFEWDLEDEVNQRLNNMEFRAPFPPMAKSYDKGVRQFFEDFDEQFRKYKVLEIEEELTFEVNGNKWRGFVDMICEHEDMGLTIADLKTSKPYSGYKLENNIGQMYLYAIAVQEKYGRYPDSLLFCYPREAMGNREQWFKFDIEKLEQTKQHVTDVIEKIKINSDWTPRCKSVDGSKDFFANQLCGQRKSCDHKNAIHNPFDEE